MKQIRCAMGPSPRCTRWSPFMYLATDDEGGTLEVCGAHKRVLVDQARRYGRAVEEHTLAARAAASIGPALLILLAMLLVFGLGSALAAWLLPFLAPSHPLIPTTLI